MLLNDLQDYYRLNIEAPDKEETDNRKQEALDTYSSFLQEAEADIKELMKSVEVEYHQISKILKENEANYSKYSLPILKKILKRVEGTSLKENCSDVEFAYITFRIIELIYNRTQPYDLNLFNEF